MHPIGKASALGLFVAVSILFVAPRLGAQESPPPTFSRDEGVYVVYRNGQVMANEKFRIVARGRTIEAKGETTITNPANSSQTLPKSTAELTLDSSWNLSSYKWRQTGLKQSRIDLTFKANLIEARVRRAGSKTKLRQFLLPANIVILDNNFMHHFALLLYRYDMARGGSQLFQVFVPQEVRPGLLNVQFLGTETIELGGQSVLLGRYKVQTESLALDVWADEKRQLRRLSFPAEGIEVIRQP
ncbi:MAG: hypothetical protein V3R60_05790 [Acidobacteriota bacterium]